MTKYTTSIEIHAKLTSVLVREIDESIHAHCVLTGMWSWDAEGLVGVRYGDSTHAICEPKCSEKLSGVLVHDIDSFRLLVDGVEQKDFPSQIRCDTTLTIDEIDYNDYDYCMVEVKECPVVYRFESLAGYFPSHLTFNVSRTTIATGLQCDFIYPYYEEECFYPLSPNFGPILRCYVVDPCGRRYKVKRLRSE
jgi:hypothetical protein